LDIVVAIRIVKVVTKYQTESFRKVVVVTRVAVEASSDVKSSY